MTKLTFLASLCLICFTFLAHAQKTPPVLKLEVQDRFLKTPPESNFINPTGVAVDSKGQIYVFNLGSNQLMVFDQNGNYLKALAQGMLMAPHGLRIDKYDNIWLTDLDQHVVIKLDIEGNLLMVLGQRSTSGEFNEELQMGLFNRPADVAFGLNDEIYVADGYGNSRVAKFDKNGKYLKAWGTKGTADGQFDNPHNIITDKSGKVYVADRNNLRVQTFDTEGKFLESWTHLGKPWGLTISNDEVIYLCDGNKGVVYQIDTKGNIKGQYTNHGKSTGQMMGSHGIAVDNNGGLFITEVFNWRVEKFIIK